MKDILVMPKVYYNNFVYSIVRHLKGKGTQQI